MSAVTDSGLDGVGGAIRRVWPEATAELSDQDLVDSLVGDGPTLRVNFVASIDGSVTHDGLSGGLSDAADKRHFELLRRVADAVMVAAGTVRDEGYTALRVSEESAEWRVANGLNRHPVFVIVSASLALDPASPIFTDVPTSGGEPLRPILITTESGRGRAALFDGLAEVVVVGEIAADVPAMLAALHARGLGHILCEGGPALFESLLVADAVDELFLTVAPTLEAGVERRLDLLALAEPRHLALAAVLSSGSTLLLRYRRR